MRYDYTLPEGIGPGEVAEALCREFPFHDLGGQRWEVCYFDTFDWRLYARGYVLEEHRSGTTRYLQWRDMKHDVPDRILPDARMPHFAHELPPGPFRDRLASCTEPRALLPQAIVHTHSHALQLQNEDGKTLLRVAVETGRVVNNDRAGATPIVSRRLRLQPLRGYETHCRAVLRAVRGLGLQPASKDVLLEALAFAGRAPGGYANRPRVTLAATDRTDDAAKRLLAASLRVLEANLPGIRARTDPEFLHDFRTGLRRARVLLGELDDVIPKRTLSRFRRDLKWLGESTGSARDLDVLLLAFDAAREALPAEDEPAMDACRAFVAGELEAAYEQLDQRLGSVRVSRLLAALEEFVQAPSPRRTPLTNAMTDVKPFADARLWRRFRKLRAAAGKADEATPAERLHRCRILAKRCRYLLDAFASLYPKAGIRELRRRLKALQNVLGEHHDNHVHRQAIAALAERMRLQESLCGATARAVGRLDEQFAAQQAALATRGAVLLREFAGEDTARLCRDLFKHPG